MTSDISFRKQKLEHNFSMAGWGCKRHFFTTDHTIKRHRNVLILLQSDNSGNKISADIKIK